jgi:hypothetical protein
MNDRQTCIVIAVAAALWGSDAKADAPKEIKTESGKP